MKCPECVATGQRSKVYSQGQTVTAMAGGEVFWDEDGNQHRHDPNRRTSGYACSKSHSFSEVSGFPCPYLNCDWTSPWQPKP